MRTTRLGALLERELHIRGQSPESFAKRVGMSTSHTYQIIRGERTNLTEKTMRKIAAGLGMTVGELYAEIGEPSPVASSDPQLSRVVRLWDHIPDAHRSSLVLIAEMSAAHRRPEPPVPSEGVAVAERGDEGGRTELHRNEGSVRTNPPHTSHYGEPELPPNVVPFAPSRPEPERQAA